ncbi:hypothetical protein A2cp1_1296 [Anaeromyxobacter dehalogenans 2CP-1]|uniref:Uncharacterized protein n=1 Tax=Anaeromyxobacter dehalogenans (strain ATCC BAA-258 / DSM 21875 / 2CP-1) TaxID=455488 RepID=B8JGG9_ANAD2|nr:hypothetical protein [Anaeromyxobacter dehalogenans]ACL64640.1 hypothetical protein A2cp1_1296 [Anaeromyxobacter dehalogenans 2CP-1]
MGTRRRLIIPRDVRYALDYWDALYEEARRDPMFTGRQAQLREVYEASRAAVLRGWWRRDPDRAESAFRLKGRRYVPKVRLVELIAGTAVDTDALDTPDGMRVTVEGG